MIHSNARLFWRTRPLHFIEVVSCLCTLAVTVSCSSGNAPVNPAPHTSAQVTGTTSSSNAHEPVNVAPKEDEIVKVTCKQMVPAAGPNAFALDHLKFNMTKQLLWTDKYGDNSAAPKMPLRIHVSPSQATWKIDAYETADGRHIFETHTYDRGKLLLMCPANPFTGAYTEQCSTDKVAK